jgi:hypothetical protein
MAYLRPKQRRSGRSELALETQQPLTVLYWMACIIDPSPHSAVDRPTIAAIIGSSEAQMRGKVVG